jgi:hypothetical protein
MPPTSFPDKPTCLIQAIPKQFLYIPPDHGFPDPNPDALKATRNAMYGGQMPFFNQTA